MQTSVTKWLDATAERFPQKIAAADSVEQTTFEELRRRAVASARSIIDAGVKSRRPVAVYLPKSVQMLVAFLGAAYAGCFYSPIDVEVPVARARKILETLEPDVVLTDIAHAEAFREIAPDAKIVTMDNSGWTEDDEAPVSRRTNAIIDTDLLYVLFTSGSTGTPKGVCISHRSVIDYIDWVVDEFSITSEDSFANQAPFYFDNSILDIYCMMKTGAELRIIPRELFAQPVRLLEYLRDNKITTIFWVPSAMTIVSRLGALNYVDLKRYLRNVLFAGEPMPTKQLNIWRRHLPNALYANLYGPTEITDVCTFYIVDRELSDDESLPIGRPMPNTVIYVLDEDRLITEEEPGAMGELCVRGTSLSWGYYRDPERTAAVFVQDPTNDAYPEKIYRTGDLVKYNERGEIIYIGRKDHQIKHMGHRIELGDIEAAASAFEGVSACCCLYDDERSRIVLFVEGRADHGELRDLLKRTLPPYMIPSRIVDIDDMPRNANGKTDRHELRRML